MSFPKLILALAAFLLTAIASSVYTLWLGIGILGAVLAGALVGMLVRVAAAHIRDRRALQTALEAMRAMEEELRQALAAAENSAKAKSEFLSHMSHELRTPLNGVMGFLQIALMNDELEDQRETLEMAENFAEELLNVIENMLNNSISA